MRGSQDAGRGTARAHARRRRSGEDGFGLVEIISSLAIIFVGFFGLASAIGSSARMVTQGGQRQIATNEASALLEDLRNVPYASVALSTQPAHLADATNPDFYVDDGGLGYDYDHDGTFEDLIVDTAGGQVTHVGQVVVEPTSLTVYQYVTWVDDPSITGTHDYKRVTAVAVYPASTPGRANSVQVSALLTEGSIAIGGVTLGATQGSAAPTASPTPSPSSTAGVCNGEGVAPSGSLTILSGTGAQIGYTASTTATLSLSASDPCTPIEYQLSNDNITYAGWTTYDAGAPTASWSLTAGDGSKSVWVHYRDGAGNQSTVGPASIILDQTNPPVPGTLTRTVNCSGNDRTVNLSWGVSTDTNHLGYRVYKSVNGGAYALLASTATSSQSDTDAKTLTSLSYKAVAYDKAGNEGNATDVITLAKNQCS